MPDQHSAIAVKQCFAFEDGDKWLVFAPEEGILFSTNKAAAERFEGLPARDVTVTAPGGTEGFSPRNLTVSTSSICVQRCIYCYGTPAHKSPEVISPEFCEAGCDFVAACSAAQGKTMLVNFHGMGEPTIPWARFVECVHIADTTASARNAKLRKSIFTGGQLSADQATFLADHIETIHVSLDGPGDIQRTQRPRQDGGDSFAPALRTAQIARQAGRSVTINVTVIDATVDRMCEITEFVARDIGPGVVVEFQDVLAVPWRQAAAVVPRSVERFLENFSHAITLGKSLGVEVLHADISVAAIMLPGLAEGIHMCLTPYDNVVAFYDLPTEGPGRPIVGTYGEFDPKTRTIRFDHDKRRRLEAELHDTSCRECICGRACGGRAWVKGRLTPDDDSRKVSCSIRQGLAREFLRRAVLEAPVLTDSPPLEHATIASSSEAPVASGENSA